MITENEESVAIILGGAGWKADPGWGGFTYGTCVGGLAPDGNVYVKNWAGIPPGHPKHSEDTPDTPEEAAQWLADRYKAAPANPLALASRQEMSDEISQHPESEQAGGAAEAFASFVGFGDNPASGEDHGSAEDGSASGGGALQPYDGQDGPGDGDREYAFDADYEEAGEELELGAELLDDEAFAKPALDAPAPVDFAPDEIKPEPEADQARFYGLDDLDRVRKLRIGDVAAAAALRIAALELGVSEKAGEHQALTSFVVTNLDKFTGAFTPHDAASLASYKRWVDLDAVHGQISVIEMKRKEATTFLLSAGREEVVSFDVEAAFA